MKNTALGFFRTLIASYKLMSGSSVIGLACLLFGLLSAAFTPNGYAVAGFGMLELSVPLTSGLLYFAFKKRRECVLGWLSFYGEGGAFIFHIIFGLVMIISIMDAQVFMTSLSGFFLFLLQVICPPLYPIGKSKSTIEDPFFAALRR